MLARVLRYLEVLPIIGVRLRKRRKRREIMQKIAEQDPYIYE